MKYIVIAVALIFVATGHALAQHGSGHRTGAQEDYFSQMATGKCWGICAYRSSMAECISCGLSYHGIEHKRGVVYYCRKLQPKCGR
jgi:predicted membrane channel-forming protein YqfA (hemolysin III family)